MKTIEIITPQGKRIVGPGESCFIIAEASSNHGRDLARAKQMIDVAAKAGADAVKFQLFKAEDIAADTADPRAVVRAKEKAVFVTKDTKLIDLYRANEFPREWVAELARYAVAKGILFLATPFDNAAVDLLESVNTPLYKIASYEMLDVPLLRHVAATKKPIIISTGMADIAEIGQALEVLRQAGNDQIVILHCRSTYPLPMADVGLRAMQAIAEAFDYPVGYSDHSLGITIPIAAAALGACVIEKHFMLDDGVATVDDKFSLNPLELKQMVVAIRDTESALGLPEKKPTEKELAERLLGRRSLWAVKDITAGEKFTVENVRSLRPGVGLSPFNYDAVIGSIATKAIKSGTPLSHEDVSK